MKSKLIMLSFGLGGHRAEMAPTKNATGHISGYEDPDSFLRRLNSGELESAAFDYDTYPDGIPVLDGREAFRAKPELSFRSPLVNTRLRGDSIDPCPTSELGDAISAGFGLVGEAYRAEARVADRPRKSLSDIGGFDYVSIKTYFDWWREFGKPFGARIGKLRRPENAPAFYEWEE